MATGVTAKRRQAPLLLLALAAMAAASLIALGFTRGSAPLAEAIPAPPVADARIPSLNAWRDQGADRFDLPGGRYRMMYAGREWAFRQAGQDADDLDLELLSGWDPR